MKHRPEGERNYASIIYHECMSHEIPRRLPGEKGGPMRVDEIPYGHENAVKRPRDPAQDRIFRSEIETANQNGDCIINVGEGYYRPVPGDETDEAELNEYLAKESSRERSIRKKRHAMMRAFWKREQEDSDEVEE